MKYKRTSSRKNSSLSFKQGGCFFFLAVFFSLWCGVFLCAEKGFSLSAQELNNIYIHLLKVSFQAEKSPQRIDKKALLPMLQKLHDIHHKRKSCMVIWYTLSV